MKIKIISIGKFGKNDANAELFKKYQQRLKWDLTLQEMEVKGNLSGRVLKQKEAEILLKNVPSGAKIIALDEKGQIFSSQEFAQKIKNFANNSFSNLAFIIGGANGLDESVRKKADLVLSFGKMTFPHMMVRPILAEQIYRACSILNNHPYHKE
jgi:23S rRNA (pseudouridine1915-N3)-methyltransferase